MRGPLADLVIARRAALSSPVHLTRCEHENRMRLFVRFVLPMQNNRFVMFAIQLYFL
jgi:hypothetical protein